MNPNKSVFDRQIYSDTVMETQQPLDEHSIENGETKANSRDKIEENKHLYISQS